MLRVIGLSLALLGVAWLGCQVESPIRSAPIEAQRDQWVRTADGWESKRSWNQDTSRLPAVHPVILALGQTLFSIWALTALCPSAMVPESEPSHAKRPRRTARSSHASSKRVIAATYR